MDRAILRDEDHGAQRVEPSNFTITTNPSGADVHTKQIAARLAALQRMGLAQAPGPNTWRVRRDFEEILRAMQRTADRQKTLATHGAPISDHRLPIEVLDLKKFVEVQGRILVHGQDEQTVVHVQDLGDSEKALKNRALLGENARALMNCGIIPTEDGWGGWLGRYQSVLVRTAHAIVQERELVRARGRKRDVSIGR
ncbi:MAG: DUF3363 domain-containing protein [Bryobacterales bacterium]|nr:DUF3363 domain-containing protein [Bryobacterales bacterium]